MNSAFVQRVIVMCIGSALTYYVGVMMMKYAYELENDNSDMTNLVGYEQKFTEHEKKAAMMLRKESSKVSFEQVIGHEKTKKELDSLVIKPLQNSQYYNKCKFFNIW